MTESPTMIAAPDTVLEGLVFPEGLRWHDGALFFSDMHDGIVWQLESGQPAARVLELPTQPSGLGWSPHGTLYVVSMFDRRLLEMAPTGVRTVADLSRICRHVINDMVVDTAGRAYIGTFGCDLNAGEPPCPTLLYCVQPDGSIDVAATDLFFPNGAVITADGKTLIVSETFGQALSAFDIESDGSLTGRREFARFATTLPDGICLDEEGGIWVASPGVQELIRVVDGGRVTDRIPLPGRDAFSCILGGPDRRDLYIGTAREYIPEKTRAQRAGRIEATRVPIAGAGLP
jgi:sugar lactone lactonase YvrE